MGREKQKERSDRKGENIREETGKIEECHPAIPYVSQGRRLSLREAEGPLRLTAKSPSCHHPAYLHPFLSDPFSLVTLLCPAP